MYRLEGEGMWVVLGERQESRFTARVASWETLSGAPANEKTSIFPATQQEPELLLIGQFIHVTSLTFT